MLQFIPGTDFIFSGYSAVPKRDNLFGGGNFDAEDFDDYNVLQRDMQIDGGVRPIREDEALAIRRRAAQAIQATYAELGFPLISDEETEAAVIAHTAMTCRRAIRWRIWWRRMPSSAAKPTFWR